MILVSTVQRLMAIEGSQALDAVLT
jgi:hypothetical protein